MKFSQALKFNSSLNNKLKRLFSSIVLLVALGTLAACKPAPVEAPQHANFEAGPVRPMAMSPDGKLLLRVNIPNATVELMSFDLDSEGNQTMQHEQSIAVGLEPVAVAFRNNNEAWVVNHLSDSVNIIKIDAETRRGHVERTLLVGDEPRDIVFAGAANSKRMAFITTAHRGQHLTHPSLANVEGAGDPQLTTPGIGRADVWVFDSQNLGTNADLGAKPQKIINLFSDTPRALAVSSDGLKVYAAAFHSGNQTSIVSNTAFLGTDCDGFLEEGEESQPCGGDGLTMPGGLAEGKIGGKVPGPSTNAFGEKQPIPSVIVKFDQQDGIWKDVLGRNFNNAIRFNNPDYDVFEIDANSLAVNQSFAHVGTILFNMALNPVNGNLYVSNLESNNFTRFEGPGIHGGSTVQGNIAPSRISVINPLSAKVTPRALNTHIDYSVLPAPQGTKEHSLATPLEMVVSSNGQTLYVAAFGSAKVGVIPTAQLDDDNQYANFDPRQQSQNYINLKAGGASGLVLDETRNKLYVSTRFDNGLSVIDLSNKEEVQHLNFATPESAAAIAGRPLLYDAFATSSNGEASCSSCHIFGDTDSLMWNLGNPDDKNKTTPVNIKLSPMPFIECVIESLTGRSLGDFQACKAKNEVNGTGVLEGIPSNKGPMTTQSLKGLQNSGHQHWRADRATGYFGSDLVGAKDSRLSFKNFIVAFEGLVGLDIKLPESSAAENKSPQVLKLESDMELFTNFIMQTYLPPNPIRNLDSSYSAAQQRGHDFYFDEDVIVDGFPGLDLIAGGQPTAFNCDGCHKVDGSQGLFGTDGDVAWTHDSQVFKIPQLRNVYTKVGVFGAMKTPTLDDPQYPNFMGDQMRSGGGVGHDGATHSVFRLLQTHNFRRYNPRVINDAFPDVTVGIPNDEVRSDLEQFVLAIDTDFAPIMGQQITLNRTQVTQSNSPQRQRLDLLEYRARTKYQSKKAGGNVYECDLKVTGMINDEPVEMFYQAQHYNYIDLIARQNGEQSEGLLNNELLALLETDNDRLNFVCMPPNSVASTLEE